MIVDGARAREELSQDQVFDVCIVGSGAVGYSIARKLAGTAKSVCVLESSFDDLRDPKVEKPYTFEKHPRWYGGEVMRKLNRGILPKQSVLKSSRSDFLTSSRTRGLGGSTNCWEGIVRPLDEEDFLNWPFLRSDLRIYYEEAMQMLGLGYFDWFDSPNDWNKLTSVDIKALDLPESGHMKTVIAQQQTDTELIEMQTNFKGLFEKYKNLTLVRNATAIDTGIEFGREIAMKTVSCSPLNKVTNEPLTPFEIKAKYFVLAMGGLETPRFLLNQFKKHKLNYPLAGQSYMSQPRYLVCAYAKKCTNLSAYQEVFYKGGVPLRTNETVLVTPYLVPTESGKEKYKTRNFRVKLEISQPNAIFFDLEFEQHPNPNSKLIVEDDIVDIFGNPVVRVEWNFCKQDAMTLTGAMEMLRDTLKPVLNFEDFRYMDWSFDRSSSLPLNDLNYQMVVPSNNHLGALRMNSTNGLDDGLLESDLKFKGFSNLYVCSTAAFPSCGWAPPTFTLMALAMRLAEMLKSLK